MNFKTISQKINKIEKKFNEAVFARGQLFINEAKIVIGNCEDCAPSSDVRLFILYLRFLFPSDKPENKPIDPKVVFSDNRIAQICERLQKEELERLAPKEFSPKKLLSLARYNIERQKVTKSDNQKESKS